MSFIVPNVDYFQVGSDFSFLLFPCSSVINLSYFILAVYFFPTFCLCSFMWDDDAGIFLKKHSNSAVVADCTYNYLLLLCVYSS